MNSDQLNYRSKKMIVLKRLQDTFCNEYLAMFGAAFGKVNPISEMVL